MFVTIAEEPFDDVMSWQCLGTEMSHRQSIGDRFENENREKVTAAAFAAAGEQGKAVTREEAGDDPWDHLTMDELRFVDDRVLWGAHVDPDHYEQVKAAITEAAANQ